MTLKICEEHHIGNPNRCADKAPNADVFGASAAGDGADQAHHGSDNSNRDRLSMTTLLQYKQQHPASSVGKAHPHHARLLNALLCGQEQRHAQRRQQPARHARPDLTAGKPPPRSQVTPARRATASPAPSLP